MGGSSVSCVVIIGLGMGKIVLKLRRTGLIFILLGFSFVFGVLSSSFGE